MKSNFLFEHNTFLHKKNLTITVKLNIVVAVPTRLELATSAVTVLRSNQLNYGTTCVVSGYFYLNPKILMEPDTGLEPVTDRLQGGCSTTELIRQNKF